MPRSLALVHVILQLHGDRIAALVAEGWRVLLNVAALVADDVAGLIRIGKLGLVGAWKIR